MTTTSVPSVRPPPSRPRTPARWPRARDRTLAYDVHPAPARSELEPLSAHWQRALDAADEAVRAAIGSVPEDDLREWRQHLVQEHRETARLLESVACVARTQPRPWLSPVPVRNTMLGLSGAVRACVFDLERVLTDSASLHAWAWGEVFDDFLLRFSQQTGRHFIPFDRVVDYRSYVDGRPRLEGVHAFLQSRGIRLPEGWTDDSPEAETANGLARRKGALLASRLRERGVAESPGARRFLEAAHRAGDKCAAISASANTSTVLELTGLAALIDVRVDAEVMRSESLRALPAPDLLLAACRGLAVLPAETAIFTCSPAAVVAGHSAGLAVIGIGDGEQAELLTGFGAERVVPSLRTLLDPRLLGPGDDPTAVGLSRGRRDT